MSNKRIRRLFHRKVILILTTSTVCLLVHIFLLIQYEEVLRIGRKHYTLQRNSQKTYTLLEDGDDKDNETILLVYNNDDVDVNDLYTDWNINVLKTYADNELSEWISPPIVLPQHGKPGELGAPVIMPIEQHSLMAEKFLENEFNLLASDMISLNRSLNDVRHPKCKKQHYPAKLPTTSIIIVFHNEARSTLLRTVWSVLNRSPMALLKEIILVDDASERDFLGKSLDAYVKELPITTYVLRSENRIGLIRARLLGAKYAKGQVITFLDAHCECTEGWLEPLLSRITNDRTKVVSPIIDVISDTTFEYLPVVEESLGAFSWRLLFKWFEMDRKYIDKTEPLRSPTMAGGLLSIDREFFYEIGAYDEGMAIWGGENLEMSFRIWQCGGTLEIIPCSRVGHIFRKKSPYTFTGDAHSIVLGNMVRIAEVWMDDWKDFFYLMNPYANKSMAGDISERVTLRKQLKCKSFRWYLENIYAGMPINYYFLGQIQNVDTGRCLDTLGHSAYQNIGTFHCHGLGGTQAFVYTHENQIMTEDNCLDAVRVNDSIQLIKCHGMRGNQEWVYEDKEKSIRHKNSNTCLTVPRDINPPTLVLRECEYALDQQWLMSSSK